MLGDQLIEWIALFWKQCWSSGLVPYREACKRYKERERRKIAGAMSIIQHRRIRVMLLQTVAESLEGSDRRAVAIAL